MLPKKYQNITRKLTIKKSAAGLGLFTEIPIKREGFVVEYTGTALSSEEADKKGGKYLFEVNSKKTVDGSGRANLARYINHSCQPNCEVKIQKERIFIFAKRNIRAGEELNYDYGKEYFNEYIKPSGCRCSRCQKKRSKDTK